MKKKIYIHVFIPKDEEKKNSHNINEINRSILS